MVHQLENLTVYKNLCFSHIIHKLDIKFIKSLIEDHRVIGKAIQILEISVNRLYRGINVDKTAFPILITFFKIFLDESHHIKEVEVLLTETEKIRNPKEKHTLLMPCFMSLILVKHY